MEKLLLPIPPSPAQIHLICGIHEFIKRNNSSAKNNRTSEIGLSTIHYDAMNIFDALLCPETETLNNFCPSRLSQVCSDLNFHQIANLYTLEKYGRTHLCLVLKKLCVSRFPIWRKWKSCHIWESLDGQKLLGISVSEFDNFWCRSGQELLNGAQTLHLTLTGLKHIQKALETLPTNHDVRFWIRETER